MAKAARTLGGAPMDICAGRQLAEIITKEQYAAAVVQGREVCKDIHAVLSYQESPM